MGVFVVPSGDASEGSDVPPSLAAGPPVVDEPLPEQARSQTDTETTKTQPSE
jgi:hypothetical protein